MRLCRRLWSTLALGATVVAAPPAAAQEAGDPEHRLEWHYPSFHPAEYVALGVLPILFVVVDHAVPGPSTPRVTGGWALDEPIQSAIGHTSTETARRYDRASNLAWNAVRYYPFLMSVAVPLLDDLNLEVAWEMTLINLAAYSLQALVKLVMVRSVARSRPATDRCLADGRAPEHCHVDNTKGFPSGHAMSAFTGAGLSCAHHTALPLYGGGAFDATACIGALGLATFTGVMRVAADKHYTSDVLAGATLGLAAGWLLPWLLHYQHASPGPEEVDAGSTGRLPVLLPWADGAGGLGLSALAIW